jgi:hypothetical protein
MKYSAGVVTKTGEIQGRAFESREEAEDYILDFAEKVGIKVGRIKNLLTGEEEAINFE